MIFSGNNNCISKLGLTLLVSTLSLSLSNGEIQFHSIRTENWVKTSREVLDNGTGASEVSSTNNGIEIRDETDSATEMPQLELPVDDCGSTNAVVTRLSLTPPCEGEGAGNGKPCILKRDVEYYLNGTLLPSIFSKNATLQINQVDPNFGFDTQLHPRKQVCGKYGVECPIVAHEPIETFFSGRFPPSFPPLKLIVRIIVYADDDAVLTCKQIPLDIQ